MLDEIQYTEGQISEPGIYNGVDISRYHDDPELFSLPSISSTGIKQLLQRPSLYWANSPLNPNRFPQEKKKKHLQFGSAAHILLLGEKGFAEKYALRPDTYPNDPTKKWNANSNDCKQWLDDHADKEIITQDQLDRIKWMRDSLGNHPNIQGGILNGPIERTMITREYDFFLRARPDVIPMASDDHADLKTTANIDHEALEKAIFNFGYHVQAAIIRHAHRSLFEREPGAYLLVFIETEPPFDTRIIHLRDVDLQAGADQLGVGLEIFDHCLKTNEWPGQDGFSKTIVNGGMPSWAVTRIQNDLRYKREELKLAKEIAA